MVTFSRLACFFPQGQMQHGSDIVLSCWAILVFCISLNFGNIICFEHLHHKRLFKPLIIYQETKWIRKSLTCRRCITSSSCSAQLWLLQLCICIKLFWRRFTFLAYLERFRYLWIVLQKKKKLKILFIVLVLHTKHA